MRRRPDAPTAAGLRRRRRSSRRGSAHLRDRHQRGAAGTRDHDRIEMLVGIHDPQFAAHAIHRGRRPEVRMLVVAGLHSRCTWRPRSPRDSRSPGPSATRTSGRHCRCETDRGTCRGSAGTIGGCDKNRSFSRGTSRRARSPPRRGPRGRRNEPPAASPGTGAARGPTRAVRLRWPTAAVAVA